ncbi:PREDICTED: methyltransferase-like protein 7A [Gekko japonicus]|uniref:Methyltransferase-like protein 7A n=1 Tax=Gekko japonicus TaxID=146911 RepID=A0ABM1KTX2_GEKJA|nr:PREDICTED: methyltransferase-like protein 7A [Gekko japonicus]XP_015277160.1 PREDICTED: methyltransferase-like protein 7A [Gekko japonicus]XP_015277162.1 PREDICTED: methyltransferase-like protein 7A [Gekko japonicus]
MAEVVVLFLTLCVQLLALPIYVLSYLGIWEPFCKKKFFPFFLEKFTVDYNQKMLRQKQDLFRNMMEFADPSGKLTVLEIGTGTGSNFQFFPPNCRVICTDPNPHFQERLAKSMVQNKHLEYGQFITTSGEALSQVPDASVDVVVSTLVLCSVKNVEAVLREVCRVLKSGGAFYFLEHVTADHSSWSFFWQRIYSPTWKLLFDGCYLTRETWADIEKASFSEIKLQHIHVPLQWTPIQPHIIGYAVK